MYEEISLRSMVDQKDGFISSNLVLRGDHFHFDLKELADGKRPDGESPEGIFDLDVGLYQADGTHPVEHSDDMEEVDNFFKNPIHLVVR
jgi:hypothetical protein